MTIKDEWVAYTGSDEQIAELRAATNGVLIRLADDKPGENEFVLQKDEDFNRGISEYWIIPDDPLREMKIRQAMTGQPVFWKSKTGGGTGTCHNSFLPFTYPTEFDYSFTEFDD